MRDRLRAQAVTAVRTTLRVLLRVLSAIWPQGRSVVVSGFPMTEGNAVECARALLRRYDGTVVWLSEGRDLPDVVRRLERDGAVLVPKASLRGLGAYLRAEAVFFTHGLYGAPAPSARKPLVNLWHGDGPKRTRPDGDTGSLIRSTYLVGSSRVFTELKGEAFEVPVERQLVTGNPRTDQCWHDVPPERLEALGITGGFVLWMPTFRRTRAIGATGTWDESGGVEVDERAQLEPLTEGLRERGWQLVVKPHPLDAEHRGWPGVLTLGDDDLARAGVGLYELLGASRGLVTDYSSVWVDYLVLDKPLAFLVGGSGGYARELRPADILEWLPGESVGTTEPFAQFLADLDAEGARDAELRRQVADRLGLARSRHAADDLLTRLGELGALAVHDVGNAD
jgi:CDP-glycerol glycerophosphotransferase